MIVSKIRKLTVRRVLSYTYILSLISLNFCFNLLIIAPFTSQAANDNVTSITLSILADEMYVGLNPDIVNKIEYNSLTPEPEAPAAPSESASSIDSDTSVSKLISEGSFIIDMGFTPQSIGNGVKPYGLIYALISDHQVPVEWVIKNSKTKDGIDFSHNSKDYSGGPFIIREEFLDSLVLIEIADWETSHSVLIDTTDSDIWVPVRASLSALPFWTLEQSGGSGTTGNTFADAGIPASAYEEISLDTLNECSSILFTDHANSSPAWSDYSRLFSWTRPILNGGRAGWIAAIGKPAELIENIEFVLTSDSIIDSVQFFAGDTLKLQFLTTEGMKEWNSSTDGPVGKYVHQYATDGEMQFVDSIDALGLDGSNKVFIPDSTSNSIWRNTTKLGVYDEGNLGVTGDTSEEAGIIVYGPAKGETGAGEVLYLGNFSNTGNNASKRNDRIIMERTFFNFSFLAAHSKNPKVETHNLSGAVTNGDSVSVVITTNEEDSANYTFAWTTNGSGSFDDSTLQNPTYFFGFYGDTTTVVITVNMIDDCGRIGFLSFPILVVPIAPGGVKPNLNLWLKADKGVTAASPVILWEDQSVEGHDAIDDDITGCDDDDDDDCVGVGPVLVENSINCNPSLRFDTLAGMYVPGGILGDSVVDEVNTFIVAFENDTSRVKWLFRESATDKYSAKATGPEMELSSPALTSSTRSAVVGDSLPYIATFNRGADSYGTLGSNNKVISHNAKVIAENTNTSTLTGTDSDFDIGNSINAGTGDDAIGQNFDGNIAEIISYNGPLTAVELNRIESYLALKYGITLDQTTGQDYLASDATTEMWDKDATGASIYDNDIAGIGRDEGSDLSQVKSKSVNYDGIVLLLAEGEGTNAVDSFIDMVDMEFFTFGNNDSSAAWVTTNSPPSFDRLERVWKVQETGEVGTVKLTFDVEDPDFDVPSVIIPGNYQFIHDTDTDGSLSDETPMEMTDEGGGLWSISGIDIDDGEIFTLATPSGIVWNGNSWSGGASTLVSGGPSDDPADAVKPMLIMAGDTAKITEDIDVASLEVDSNAILEVTPTYCMIISGSVTVHDSASVVLTATSDSTYAQYHGEAMANTTVEMMLEHYDWHQIASPVGGTTLADLEAENSAGGEGYIVYAADHVIPWGDTSQIRWYETQDYNGGTNIGYGADSSYSDAFGTWYGGKSTDSLDGRDGYMIFVNATLTQDTPLPLKLKITGTTNDTSRSTSTDVDNYGWTMVSNPYPCAIDWETIEARVGTGTNDTTYDFLPTVSIWEPANQNYATYLADSSGTSGVAANNNGTGVDLSDGARYIAPFQSFWVQRSDHKEEDAGTSDPKMFTVLPTDRVVCEQPKHFRYTTFDYSVMRVKLTSEDNPYTDELLLRFGDQFRDGYSNSKDAHKLSSPNLDVALISTKVGGKSLVIHSRSIPDERTSIPIWTKAPLGARLKVEITNRPERWSTWLVEVATGNTFAIKHGAIEFVNYVKGNNHRFDLIIKDGFEEPDLVSANVYTRNNSIEIYFDYPGIKKKVVVKDLLGRVVYSTTVVDQERVVLPFNNFAKQTYLIHIITKTDSKLFKVIP